MSPLPSAARWGLHAFPSPIAKGWEAGSGVRGAGPRAKPAALSSAQLRLGAHRPADAPRPLHAL